MCSTLLSALHQNIFLWTAGQRFFAPPCVAGNSALALGGAILSTRLSADSIGALVIDHHSLEHFLRARLEHGVVAGIHLPQQFASAHADLEGIEHHVWE